MEAEDGLHDGRQAAGVSGGPSAKCAVPEHNGPSLAQGADLGVVPVVRLLALSSDTTARSFLGAGRDLMLS